jgi:Bacterial Ig-like domain (group 1)/Invasin, domain 3
MATVSQRIARHRLLRICIPAVLLMTVAAPLAEWPHAALAASPRGNGSTSTLVASPTSVVADGSSSSTLTATVRNNKRTPLAGKTVTLAQISGPAAVISAPSGASNGSGVVTWTVASTAAGVDVFRAMDTTDNIQIKRTATVTFLAGVPNPANSSVSANPSSVVADGVTASRVTVTLRDVNNNPAPGKTVTLAQTAGQPAAISPSSGPSTSAGVVTFQVSSSVVGSTTFSATDTTDSNLVIGSTGVAFTTGPVNVLNSTVSASPQSLPADGTSSTVVTVVLRDASNNPVPAKTVALTQVSGPAATITPPTSAVSNGSGAVTFTVASTAAGSDSFQATDTTDSNLVIGSTAVTFTPGPISGSKSTVVAAPAAVPANGSTPSVITVTERDNSNNPISGDSIQLTETNGPASLISGTNPATTNASGVVTFSVTSTVAGIATYDATDQTVSVDVGNVDVTFNPGAVNVVNSSVVASPASLPAGGSTSKVTVTLLDANNNPVPGKTVVLSQTGGPLATIGLASGPSDAAGKVTFFISSLAAGTVSLSATDTTDSNLVVGSAGITFTTGPVSGSGTVMSAGPTPVVADGLATSTATVTVRDTNNNPVAGKTVSLAQMGGPPAVITAPVSTVSDANGQVAFTLSSVNPGVDTFQATADLVTVTQTAAVDFTRQLQTAVSTDQYTLTGSDGATWTDMDTVLLSMTVTPTVDSMAILNANADLWTANAGFNQDLGISVSPADTTVYPSNIVAWKESGGFAGTFSPNAAAVHTVFPMTANTTYTVKLQWKSNKPASGATIYAGAGPWPGGGVSFSPTSLSAELIPTAAAALDTAVSRQQYTLTNSDGTTWSNMDPATLSLNVTPSADSLALLTANSDLWTSTAGFNQDLGISVTPSSTSTYPSNIVAWKESGGFAGTFSPNAAAAETLFPMTHGVTYTVKLQWKTNKPAAGATIWAGAGPVSGFFSPTRLSALLLPTGSTVQSTSSRSQYTLSSSDGNTWVDPSAGTVHLTLTPTVDSIAIITGNADLWTAKSGFNQDLGISVSPVDTGIFPQSIVAWKESGGFAGTFSPNAAMARTVVPLEGGTTYSVSLRWKTNIPSGATIYDGAGPWPSGGSLFSPAFLTALMYPTS